MAIIIGVSSGIFGAATQEERFAFTSVGLAKKAQYAITKGVDFVQIDLESLAEFEEADIKEKMDQVKRLGISFGIHAETPAFGSREFPHLDSAIKPDYRRGHERLIHNLEKSAELEAKYYLVHSSESTPFIFLSKEFQPSDLVDPWGRDLANFIRDHENIYIQFGDKKIIDSWLWHQYELWQDVFHANPEESLKAELRSREQGLREQTTRDLVAQQAREKRNEKIIDVVNKEFGDKLAQAEQKVRFLDDAIAAQHFESPEQFAAVVKQREIALQEVSQIKAQQAEKIRKLELTTTLTPEEVKEASKTIEQLSSERIEKESEITFEKDKPDLIQTITTADYEAFLRAVQNRNLAYGPEKIAYFIMAKWMEVTDHPLWRPIIDITISYYAKKENKTSEQWKKDHKIEKVSIDDQYFAKDYRLWVPSVSALYVYGHFVPSSAPPSKSKAKPEFNVRSPVDILEKKKIYFVFETPMAASGMEDLLRFPQPAQMYYLVKAINSIFLGIAVDIEHMLMDGLNVETAIDIMPQEAGKWIRVIHTGYPSPLGPAHIPIPLGSDQQLYLYKTYWKMRQKGMGRNGDVFMIFERTGGADPIQQTVIALRLIKKFLEMDYPPEKLPLEFFGLEAGQWASTERQRAQMLEHAYDPLKGTLQVPEEEHGLLGKTAIEKGKGEEWRKEKYR